MLNYRPTIHKIVVVDMFRKTILDI